MTKLELINKSLLPYLTGKKPLGIIQIGSQKTVRCRYYNAETKASCAIGQWLKEPERFTGMLGSAPAFFQQYLPNDVLQTEVQNILTVEEWGCVQQIHDSYAMETVQLSIILELEESIGEPLTEIRAILDGKIEE